MYKFILVFCKYGGGLIVADFLLFYLIYFNEASLSTEIPW